MKRVIWFLFIAVVAALLAIAARRAEGNVAILIPPYRIDLSLNAAVLILLGTFIAGYVLLGVANAARRLPEQARAYRARRRLEGASASLAAAVRAMVEGRWSRAVTLAASAAEQPETAGAASLIAARASAQLGETDRTAKWIARAGETSDMQAAIDVLQAEIALDAREPHKALEAIERVQARGARHVHTLRLKLKAAVALQHWEDVLRLARQLEKHKALHPLAAAKTKSDAYEALFQRLQGDAYGVNALWQQVPAAERKDPAVALAAAQAFDAADLGLQSRMVLEAALAQHWDERLIAAYAQGHENSMAARIAQAEAWLERHSTDGALLVALGRLCLREQLWGKARQYLERSLAYRNAPDTHALLGELAEQSGDRDAAFTHFQRAAKV